ncbi:MAG: hypothetical protein ACE5J7_01065 [Candidatus Aenigmatarchaeota archaeon]
MSEAVIKKPRNYNPLKTFNARKPVELKDLKSVDTAYLDEIERMLENESKERGEECVIGVWGMRYGMEFRNAGFGLYTRSEADELEERTRLHGPTAPYFAGYVSVEDLGQIKKRLANKSRQ